MDFPALIRSTFLAALAIGAGALLPIQAGSNAALARAMGSTYVAVFVSLAVSAVLAFVAVIVLRAPTPNRLDLVSLPVWAWLGGILGAGYLVSITIVAPRLGAASTLALVVLGQMVCAITLDHFGLVGFVQRLADPLRLLGVALVACGAFLVAKA